MKLVQHKKKTPQPIEPNIFNLNNNDKITAQTNSTKKPDRKDKQTAGQTDGRTLGQTIVKC